MLPAFAGLTVACGIGVFNAAGRRRALRAIGVVLLAFGATGIAWLPFPHVLTRGHCPLLGERQ